MDTTAKARRLRRNATDAERKLWSMLRKRQLAGCRFRRQVPIGNYIVDFACFEKKLAIELDGGQHLDQSRYDVRRTRWLESRGFRVVRFWNDQVFTEPDGVYRSIMAAVQGRESPPS